MKVPDKFPPGSRFVPTFGGDWFAELPGKGWFKLSDDGETLGECPLMKLPPSGGITISDDPSGLLSDAAAPRRWKEARAAS